MRIAIGGKAGVGKTTMARYLAEKYDYKIISIADQVKFIARLIFDMKTKDRALLQEIGKKMREIKETVWIDYTIKRVFEAETDRVVIDDMRFPNEYNRFKENGFVLVKVVADREICIQRLRERDGDIDISRLDDESETALDNIEFENVIENNGTFEEFYEKIDKLMTKLGILKNLL